MSTTHKPQRVENYMSEPGTVVHLKVKISKEFLWLSSLTNAQVHTGRYIWASRLGGLERQPPQRRSFFMSDACGWKWNPWLVCPGAKIWTPGLKERLYWKNSRPPYAEIGQWDFFNLHLVLGRGSRKSTERNVSELNEGRGEKKVVLWNHEKHWFNV